MLGGGSRAAMREHALGGWFKRRTYRGERYTADRLREQKTETVSVVLPARNVEDTLGSVLDGLVRLEAAGLLDEIVVVDGASTDGTVDVAADRDVTVHQESDLMADHGPSLGKGDAMWRGVAATTGELVVFLDTDTEDFTAAFALGLLGPLFEDPDLHFVKGSFRRPFRVGESVVADGGGRVTELTARPIFNLYVPELAGFVQPLAGEIAARRWLLEQLSFPVGYGIETGMLIDALRLVGIDALGQVDLGTRQNRHQPLRDLAGMAYAVLVTALTRVDGPAPVDRLEPGVIAIPHGDGFEPREVVLDERPPLVSLAQPERAGGPG